MWEQEFPDFPNYGYLEPLPTILDVHYKNMLKSRNNIEEQKLWKIQKIRANWLGRG